MSIHLLVLDEYDKIVVANIISCMCFLLARERGRITKTTKMMASVITQREV